MKGLMKKVRENKKGFTLAELLVVVAIVGILVAISIPVFTAQLGKARKATNQANMRAAKAAAVAQYMTEEAVNSKDTSDTVEYKYDLNTGSVSKESIPATGFVATEIDNATTKEKYTEMYVKITPKNVATDKDNAISGADILVYVKEVK